MRTNVPSRQSARIASALVLLSFLTTVFMTTAARAEDEAYSRGVWGQLEFVDLEGREWSSESLLGRIVLIDFWATWCAPCLAEFPNLKGIQEELAGEDLVVVGVSVDRMERSKLRSFLLRHELDWTQVHDGRGLATPLARRFGVEAVPRTVVIDRSGRLVAVDLKGKALYTLLRDLQYSHQEGSAPGS